MSHNAFFTRLKWMFILMLAMILDIFPIPVLGLVFLYVLLFRPLWFKDAVLEIYELKPRTDSNHSNQEN
jgi:hypothetical protein